ncbi:hypothetical protein RIF29_08808 [Crotalaria pallida]|uniref:BTB domain-containing protein n=1 Tax=Crotalaria pallida TaxID=3830 RepID=A0AAN9IJ59_CROPI
MKVACLLDLFFGKEFGPKAQHGLFLATHPVWSIASPVTLLILGFRVHLYGDTDNTSKFTMQRHSAEKANGRCEKLKRDIEELRSRVNFLKLLPPWDPVFQINPCALFSNHDVFLVPHGDSSPEPIRVHKAILWTLASPSLSLGAPSIDCIVLKEKANGRREKLKRHIEELESKINFLNSCPLGTPYFISTLVLFFSNHNVFLVPHGDSSPGPIRVHKAIFVSRSPYFKAMLESDIEDSQNVTLHVDISYDSLRAFVNYLYTAEACLDDHMAFDLFVAAEKYQVNPLKEYCEKFLIAGLNQENAIANYTFAQEHDAKQLLDSVKVCIAANKYKFIRSEAYANLKRTNLPLVLEILEASITNEINSLEEERVAN